MYNECFDLTKEQEGLWFEYKLRPQGNSYNAYVITKIDGLLNVKRFMEADYESANHLYTPRTKFKENDKGEVKQYILPRVKQSTLYVDLSKSSSEESSDAQARKILKGISDKPFDLENDMLLRTALVSVSEIEFYYMTCMHHIICDSWSADIYHKVLAHIYNNGADGVHAIYPQKTVKEYSQTIAEVNGGGDNSNAEKYWGARLAGSRLHFDLGVNYSHLQSVERKERNFVIGEEIAYDLKGLARKCKTTLFLVLMSVINVLLYRYWSKNDICVGYDVNSRPKGFKDAAGNFVKVFPMRVFVDGDDTFLEVIKKVTANRKLDSKYQNISYPEIVEVYRKNEKSTGHDLNVFFGQTSFELSGIHFNNLRCKTVDIFAGSMDLDLEFTYDPILKDLPFLLRYNGNKFTEQFLSCMIKNLQVLIGSIIANPDVKIANLDLINPYEKKVLVSDWNNNSVDSHGSVSVNRLFEDQVGRAAGEIAVVCGDDEVTYDDLNERSNSLARYLLSLGVGPENLVGVYMARSVDMVVALLAVMKSGAAYVPLDPMYPQDRLKFVIEDSAPELILTEGLLAKSLLNIGFRVVVLDSIEEDALHGVSDIDLPKVDGSNRMYVIYTSGSTGKPKGVQIRHSNVVNFLRSMERSPGFTRDDSLLAVTTISFDISVLELFLPLVAGARVVVMSHAESMNAESIQSALSCHDITVMQATPSTWQMLENIGWQGSSGLKVLCGGEPLPALLAARLLEKVGSLWNMYGPTETTIWSTLAQVTDAEQISIGRPIDNTEIYILDNNLSLCPIGVAGTLYIGGRGVSEGYFKREALTQERFVVNPFKGGGREIIYNTGDLCRYLPDGDIVHLGRIDNQVKLRGYRIELGEIESVLCQHEKVDQSVVIVSGDTLSGQYIVAYVVVSQDNTSSFQVDQLREFARSKLPEYMMPLAFVELLELPLLPNGKVDNKSLPVPNSKSLAVETSYVPPDNDNEKIIAQVWSEVLGRDRIGRDDNFFDIGGNSILLAKIYSRLQAVLDNTFELLDMFKYPTVHSFANSLNGSAVVGSLPRKMSVRGRKLRMSSMSKKRRSGKKLIHSKKNSNEGHIAIVGMSCRFPDASDVKSFWQNLKNGKESIVSFSDEELREAGIPAELIADPSYIKVGSILDDVDKFDADFFNFSPREAEILDPQQRIFLECSWEALENAGYCSDYYDGVISVFAGQGINTYMLGNMASVDRATNDKFDFFTANDKDFLATRVSYKLNLKGPSLTVQSACSTSMVAVHLACQSLQIGESDMALAGGVSVRVPQVEGYLHTGGYPLSADGHCSTFDEDANGTVFGNGAGVIVLKRLEDAIEDNDHVYAVVRSIAINNDGSSKIGFTAPSVQGQAEVIVEAHELAEVDPGSITYVEAHGTGTELGDPIEVAALTEAFRINTSAKGFCAIGSLKTNVGHMDTAAGVGAIIKTALSLKNRMIPPSLNFRKPNPKIDFDNSPFYVNTELRDWEVRDGLPRRAGVSAFGIGGTNAHLILEEFPPRDSAEKSRPWQLITLSARTEAALDKMTSDLVLFLKGDEDSNLPDIAFTLNTGRKTFNYRRVCVVDDVKNASASLENLDRKRVFTTYSDANNSRLVFMFPGQDSIYMNMGSDLYAHEPLFKHHVDYCAERLKAHLDLDIRDILFCADGSPTEESRHSFANIRFMQPMVFVFEYALARLWMEWGIKPDAMIGHSIGEYVAACLSGVMSLDDALDIVAYRGGLLEKLPDGKNIAVSLSEKDIKKYLTEALSIAVITTSSLCVVSGRDDDVNTLEQRLQADGVEYKSLNIPKAAHSILMEPIVEPLRGKFKNITLNPPQVPFVSCITGEWIKPEQAVDPDYWAMHVRKTVRFADAIRTIADREEQVLIEVGPGRALSSLVKLHVGRRSKHVVLASTRNPQSDEGDDEFFLKSLGRVWLAGIGVDWRQYYKNETRHRVPLPTYPFERKRFWIESSGHDPSPKSQDKKAGVAEYLLAPSWKRSVPLAPRLDFDGEGWLLFHDEAGLARQVCGQLLAGQQHVMEVHQGFAGSEKSIAGQYFCDSGDEEACGSLIRTIVEEGRRIDKVMLFLDPVMDDGERATLSVEKIGPCLEQTFFRLLNIVRALEVHQDNEVQVNVVSRCGAIVTGDEDVDPFHGLVAAMLRVIHNEASKIKCRNIDFAIEQGRTSFRDHELDQLMSELAGEIDARLVAYRGLYRWTQCFEGLSLAGRKPSAISVKDGGVYLLTGGLDGLGYVLAKHLAGQGCLNLVIADAAYLPRPEEWQGWLDEHGDDHETSLKIKRILDLQELGSKVVVHTVEVSNLEKMAAVVAQIRDELGVVDGVIHAAGPHGLSGFLGQGRQDADKVFQDKIVGAVVLAQVLAGECPDFFVLCSSITAIIGSIGKVVNSSADAFLDSFAHMGLVRSGTVMRSINFDMVQGCMGEYQGPGGLCYVSGPGEMQEPFLPNGYQEYLGQQMDMALSAAEVGDVFEQALVAPVPQIVVSTRDVELRKAENRNFLKSKSAGSETLAAGTRYERPQLDNSYKAPENSTEMLLAGIWEEVLGIDKIGVYDSFFDLGGNSLLATRVISRIRETFGVTVPVKILFKYLYIRDLSQLILDQKRQGDMSMDDVSSILKQKKKTTV